MFVIGLLLLAAAVAVGIDVAAQNNTQIDIDAFGQTFTSSIAVAFVAGVVTALVGAIGLFLLIDGLRRRRVQRREQRAIVAERDRLAAEREREVAAMAHAHEEERDGALARNLDLRDPGAELAAPERDDALRTQPSSNA